MTGYVQAGLETAPPPDAGDKVLVPRDRLLDLARRWWDEPGRRGDASFIRAGCIGQGELVPVSRALVDAWDLAAD